MIFLIVNCAKPISDSNTLPTNLNNEIRTISPSPSHPLTSPMPTIYPPSTVSSTPLLTPIPTYSISLASTLVYSRCLEKRNLGIKELSIKGILVTHGYGLSTPAYLIDLESGISTTITKQDDEITSDIAVSPDGSRLVYSIKKRLSQDNRRIFITDLNGRQLLNLPVQNDWQLEKWLDNEHLVFTRRGKDELDLWSVIVFNPFTGRQMEYLSIYPDIDQTSILLWNPSRAFYDATFSRVIYPSLISHDLILWNVKTAEAITKIPSSFLGIQPEWSPDGSQVLVMGWMGPRPDGVQFNPTLISVGRNGEQSALIKLDQTHPLIAWIDFIKWSPDSSKIAIWMKFNNTDHTESHFGTYDLGLHQLIDFCLQANVHTGSVVWSPDSRAIIFGADNSSGGIDVFLVDLTRSFVTKILENMLPYGWMASEK